MNEIPYILGHSESELRRLTLQGAVLKPTTERLLRETGIGPGLLVLDLGCGAGDVAFLAAELVGPSGAVVGIDRSADAVAFARQRARALGFRNVEFHQAAAENFVASRPFDLAVGRYVLIHQSDPAAFIRAAAAHVRPGGTVAFQEIAIYDDYCTLVPIALWRQAIHWAITGLASVMEHPFAGGQMMAHFHDADLGRPVVFAEIPVDGGRESPFYAWLALSVRSLMPQIEKMGIATAAEIDIDSLEDRLRDAVSEAHGQAIMPPQFCGWARV